MEGLSVTENIGVCFSFCDKLKHSTFIFTVVPGDDENTLLSSRYRMQYVDFTPAPDHSMVFNVNRTCSGKINHKRKVL